MKRWLLLFSVILAPIWVARAQLDADHIVMVLDGSGSMKGKMGGVIKMQAARQAIAEVLKHVPTDTQIGLLVFSQSVAGDGWVFPLGPRDDDKLVRAMRRVVANGQTPLGMFMKRGSDRLLEAREANLGYGTYRLLVVTDGQATDAALMQRYAPEIMARGISLDVIGVAMEQDHLLARSANSYRRANDPVALQQAIAEVLAEVGSSGGGVVDESAFEVLEGLPDEVALAAVQALTRISNKPIGARNSPMIEPSPNQAPPIQAPMHPPPRMKKKGLDFGSVFIGFIVIVIVGSVLRKFFKN